VAGSGSVGLGGHDVRWSSGIRFRYRRSVRLEPSAPRIDHEWRGRRPSSHYVSFELHAREHELRTIIPLRISVE
jgi:hypothetical protein